MCPERFVSDLSRHHILAPEWRVTPTSHLCPRYKWPSRYPFLSTRTEFNYPDSVQQMKGESDELDRNGYEANNEHASR